MSVSRIGRNRCCFSCFSGMLLLLFPLLLAGCGSRGLQMPSSSGAEARMTADIRELLEQRREVVEAGSCRRSLTETDRDACYRHTPAPQRPAASIMPKTAPDPSEKKTKATTGKNTVPKAAPSNARKKNTAQSIRGGLCQPQCLIYVRCRTGFKTCMLGNTTSVNWAACARQNGALSSLPVAGSAMLIDRHKNITSGHVVYVEETCRLESGNWLLRISHANYDGRCLLDLDSKALYFPKTERLTVLTGPWGRWGKDLRVLGFITR